MLTSRYLHLNPSKALGPDRILPKDLKLTQRSLLSKACLKSLKRARIVVSSPSSGKNLQLYLSLKRE